MPRPIKNDTPSNAQLQDLIRPIVKSEIRRRDGAITSIPIDPNGGLEFTGSGLSVKAGTSDMILLTSAGLDIKHLTRDSDGPRWDADSYIAVINGSVLWTIQDGYDLTAGKSINIIGDDTIGLSCKSDMGLTSEGQIKIASTASTGIQSSVDINLLALNFIVLYCGSDITIDSGGGQIFISSAITVFANALGFFGANPVARPGTYTITAAPAVATALNADANGGVNYAGVPAALADAATRANLNDLRGDVASLAAVLRQLIKHLGDTTGLGLINETSY